MKRVEEMDDDVLRAYFASGTMVGDPNELRFDDDRTYGTLTSLARSTNVKDVFTACATKILATTATSIPIFRALLATQMSIDAKGNTARFLEIQRLRDLPKWVEQEMEEVDYLPYEEVQRAETKDGSLTIRNRNTDEEMNLDPISKDGNYIFVRYPTYCEIWINKETDRTKNVEASPAHVLHFSDLFKMTMYGTSDNFMNTLVPGLRKRQTFHLKHSTRSVLAIQNNSLVWVLASVADPRSFAFLSLAANGTLTVSTSAAGALVGEIFIDPTGTVAMAARGEGTRWKAVHLHQMPAGYVTFLDPRNMALQSLRKNLTVATYASRDSSFYLEISII